MTDPIDSATARILVVDDDEHLRRLYMRWLDSRGYTPVGAGSGREAVELVRADPDGFDLVILDMVMDDMSGLHTFELMQEAQPGLKVLLCSGYKIDRQVGIVLDAGAIGFLQKPFDVDEITRAVAKALVPADEPEPSGN